MTRPRPPAVGDIGVSTARIPDGTPLGLFQVGPDDVADTSDDWYTPPWLFKAAGLTFDMDVAAPVNPARRTCPARTYLTPVEDGLAHPWSGLIGMNPPFSRSRPWVERFAEHGCGLALMPVLRTTALGMMTQCADAIALLNIRFMRSGVHSTVPFPMLLAARGPVAVNALARVAAIDPFAGGAWHVRPGLEQIPEPRAAAQGTLL